MVQAYTFGHPVYGDSDGHWRLEDGRRVHDPAVRRQLRCPRCGERPTPKGHDPCIADLPGAIGACCGHGVEPGYVVFDDGTRLDERYDGPIDWDALRRAGKPCGADQRTIRVR